MVKTPEVDIPTQKLNHSYPETLTFLTFNIPNQKC